MRQRPVIFGEVLFDCFPDGDALLGGAPFNVAWHLQGLGFAPCFLSRIGDDAPGRQILEAMDEWGLDGIGVQRDPAHPTGVVEITFEGEHHAFRILEEQAYDFMDAEPVSRVVSSITPALLYHGTLAARGKTSRRTLDRLLEIEPLDVFVDVNLRDPFWRVEDLPLFLARARWCKINDDEVRTVTGVLDLPYQDLEDQARALRDRFDLDLLILTLGADGAMAFTADGNEAGVCPDREVEVVDTIGAGDAFASVTIAGLISGWSIEETLTRAQSFASAICGARGAIVRERGFYENELQQWQAHTDDE